MGENNKLKTRWFKDVIASSASVGRKKGNTYGLQAGQEHKSLEKTQEQERQAHHNEIN